MCLIGVKETYVQEKKKVTKNFLGQICTTVSGLNSLVCWFAACPVPRLETFARTNGPVTIHNHSRLSRLLDEEVGCAGEEQAPGIQTAGVELTQLGVALRQCAVRLPVRLLEHVLHQSHLGTQLLNNQPAPVIPFTYITCSFSKEQPTSTSYDFYYTTCSFSKKEPTSTSQTF